MDAIVYDKVGKEAEKVRDALYGIYPQETITDAAIASFDDGADGIPVKVLTVGIEPVQAGSGDPSPDNVRPISGWTGAEIERTGVNVWDEEWEIGALGSSGDIDVSLTTRITTSFISVIEGNSYYMPPPCLNGRYAYYDAEKNLVSFNGSGFNTNVNTVPSGVYYLRITLTSSYGTTYNHDISINYPAIDTTYAPYTGNQISVNWETEAGTVYGGTLTINPDRTGTLVVDRAIADLGTLNWVSEHDVAPGQFRYDFQSAQIAFYATMHCSQYKCDNAISYASVPNEYIVTSNNVSTPMLRIHDERFSSYTGSEAKTALEGVQLVYGLSTPIPYQLTAEQVSGILSTLYGTNNIWASTGNIKKLTYRTDLGKYIDSHITTAVADALNA